MQKLYVAPEMEIVAFTANQAIAANGDEFDYDAGGVAPAVS